MPQHELILIADDEKDAAELLRFRLERHGYRTVLAVDGQETLNAAFGCHPDLLILDLMMPNLDGFQVCRMLKTSPLIKHIPIIILSAMDTAKHKLRSFRQGVDDYVTKPFDMNELLARIQALLNRTYDPSHH